MILPIIHSGHTRTQKPRADDYEELMDAEINKLKEDIFNDFPNTFANTLKQYVEAVGDPLNL